MSLTTLTRCAGSRPGRASSSCLEPRQRILAWPRSTCRAPLSAATRSRHALALSAGTGGAKNGTLTLSLEGRPIAAMPLDSLPPFGERTVTLRARFEGAPGPAVLRAVVSSSGDTEPRNDTLSIAIDLSRAASAVFVSTSPDFDARYALAVLRGALGIPTRGFFRVAPGEWRVEGALTPVPETEVRQAVRDAPVAIMHGDTAAFGPPRATTLGPLALIVTIADGRRVVSVGRAAVAARAGALRVHVG